MAKPELGTKRLCANCSAKFYDLSKTPITCPKCHTVMEIAAVTTRPRPEPARAAAAAPVKEAEAVVPETPDAEFVSSRTPTPRRKARRSPATRRSRTTTISRSMTSRWTMPPYPGDRGIG